MTEPTVPIEGWYPDPAGGGGLRWWTGVTWTEDTRAAPRPSVQTPAQIPAQPVTRPTSPVWSPVVPDPGDDAVSADAVPARHRARTRWIAAGVALVLVGVVAVGSGVAVSVASRNKLDMGAVENEIAAQISASSGLRTTVSCPGSVDIAAGTTFTCEATTDDGVRSTVTVHQDDDQGNLTFGLPQ